MKNTKKDNYSFLYRYIHGMYTYAELKKDLPHLLNPERRKETFRYMDDLWEESGEKSLSSDPEEMIRYKQEALSLLKTIRKEDVHKTSVKRLSFGWIKYAAIFILVSGIAFGIYRMTQYSPASVVFTTVYVENGQHKTINLPDGSTVMLNACSKLTIPDEFTGEERRVILDGEAYFSVRPDKMKPFVVEAGDVTAKVLGTTFNMKTYSEDDQYIFCVESGKVQVELPEAIIRLTPDEQILMNRKNGDFFKQQEPSERVLNWREKGLYFNSTPLRTVINELYRVYNKTIELAANVDKTILIYGEHDNKSFESVLKSVCYATGLEYRIEPDKVVIYKP